ncbi:hypothetical protein MYX76_15345 [Desulfobacterota bacterium AH_259_B03_O07]|nr:hypothetical protein [Desulfobacterota bacterium AH_259_B03_O07]
MSIKGRKPKINLEAPIIPGKTAAGINIGSSEKTVLAALPEPKSVEELYEGYKLIFDSIWVVIEKERVTFIGVSKGYKGRLPSGMGIGSKIRDVIKCYGDIEVGEQGSLRVVGAKDWGFDTEEWVQESKEIPKIIAAPLTKIFVHEPYD